VQRLLAALEDPDLDLAEKLAAVRAMAKLGPVAGKAIPVLTQRLGDRDQPSSLRQATAIALGAIDSSAPGVHEALLLALKDQDPIVVIGAALAFARPATNAAAVVPALLETLGAAQHPGSRYYLVQALGANGAAAAPALPVLDRLGAQAQGNVQAEARRSAARIRAAVERTQRDRLEADRSRR
jgi:hypothetical protein